MSALAQVQAARAELHKSTYWPAAQRQKGSNHLWLTDVYLAAAIAALTPPAVPLTVSISGTPTQGQTLAGAIQ